MQNLIIRTAGNVFTIYLSSALSIMYDLIPVSGVHEVKVPNHQ